MEKEKSNGMSLLVECESCQKKFEINSSEDAHSVTHKKKFQVNDEIIYLTFYDCPYCGRRHYVQIDNVRTLEMLKKVSHDFIVLATLKKKGNSIPQKQSAKFERARKHLATSRTELMKKYTDTLVHDDETDSDFELRFSV